MNPITSILLLLAGHYLLISITHVLGDFSQGHARRVKRVMDGTPRPKTTAAPLTSEEMREKISGTESPHINDYPDEIYKTPELMQSQWTNNNKTKNHTVTETVISKNVTDGKATGIRSGDESLPGPQIQELLSGLGLG